MSAVTVLAEGLAFPEGPAVAADGAIWVSELGRGAIVRVSGAGAPERFVTGGAPNGLAHAADGSVWFCDQAANLIRRLDPRTAIVTTIADGIEGEPLAAPNDLAFAPDGTLVFTCPGDSRTVPTGSLCRRRADGTVERVATGLLFPNGLCFSPDGHWIFVAETYGRRVLTGPWHGAAPLALRPLVDTPGPIGADGVAITRAGLVATCVHGAGIVRLFDPASGAVRDIGLPDARPAGCAADPFGRWSLIVTGTEHGIVLGLTW